MSSTMLQPIPDGGTFYPLHISPGNEIDDVNFGTDKEVSKMVTNALGV